MVNSGTEQIDLAAQRDALFKEKQIQKNIINTLEDSGLDQTLTEAIGDLSSIDQHAADHGSEMYEREKDLGLKERAESVLEKIDRAFERIDNGTYSTCETCGGDIEHNRLRALPYASRCVECEEKHESALEDERPVSERDGELTMGNTRADGDVDMGYDGDDVWDELSRYGTANSPQDVPQTIDADDENV